MTSIQVPSADLVPSVSSRVVTIDVTDMQEGAAAEGYIDFILPCDLHVPADDKIVRAGSVRVTLDGGKGEVRLPTYDQDARTPDGSDDWVILVKKSWTGGSCGHGRGCGCGGAYAVRVPVGTSRISLADLPAVRPLTRREQQYAITGVSVSVTTGAPASATGAVRGGILDLDFTFPMGNDFVKGYLADGTDWDTVTEPGLYQLSTGYSYINPAPGYTPEAAGVLLVLGTSNGWGAQEYIQHGGSPVRVWRVTIAIGEWNAWQRPIDDHGRIPDGTDLDTLRDPGQHRVEGGAHAGTLTNLPPGVSTGTVLVLESGQMSGNIQTQVVYGYAQQGVWSRTVQNTSGAWGVWLPLTSDWGDLPGYTDLNTLRVPGSYRISGETVAGTLINSPVTDNAATVVVHETGQTSGMMQTQLVYGAADRGLWERHVMTTAGDWSEWVDLLEATENYWAQHSLRVSEFSRRRGGMLGTIGAGAVAFRWDHNWDDFITPGGIADLVEEYAIVSSMALPGYEFTPGYRGESTTGSWADIRDWALAHGMEIMSHSYTHDDAQTITGLDTEIRYSRVHLEQQLDQIKIDVWAQPGVTPPTGKTAYMGMDALTSIERIYGSRAGRMLMANYAVVGGHNDGYYRELAGTVDQALAHYTIESHTTAQPVIDLIDQAAASGTGLVLMAHPNVIDTEGNMSLAVLEEVFAHVADLRDRGRLQNLTVGGMALADSSSSRRRDLAINGRFVDGMAHWTGAGWTIQDGHAVSPPDSTPLEQGLYWSRRAAIAGSWQELVVEASADSAADMTVRAWDNSNPGLLDVSRTVSIGAGSSLTVRVPFGIPFMQDASVPAIMPKWSIASTSGAIIRVKSIRVQAI